jgi:hypothetical protein
VLAAEHLLGLGRVNGRRQGVERLKKVAAYVLTLPGPLDQDGQVGLAPAEILDGLAILLQTPASLEHPLRLGLVLPEIGGRRPRLEPLQLVGRMKGVKDTL